MFSKQRRWNYLTHALWRTTEVKSPSRVWLFAILWTVVCQAPLFMGFSRQETGVGCHFLLQGTFLTQGSYLGLSHYRKTLYCLSHQKSLRTTALVLSCQNHPDNFKNSYILMWSVGVWWQSNQIIEWNVQNTSLYFEISFFPPLRILFFIYFY